MQYLDQEGKVVYTTEDGKSSKVFPAQEWLATHVLAHPERRLADGVALKILQHYQRLQFFMAGVRLH